MPDVLIAADTIRSPELRHEVPVVAGDVIALEPGLYRKGYGGVRL